MRALQLVWSVAALSIVTGCKIEKIRDPNHDNRPAETAGPHFASLCVARSDWPRLLSTMRDFGAEHHLEMHGGIESDNPHGPIINAYLAQGYSYYFGDDFDLWFVSGFSDKDPVFFNGLLKRKPITREQQALAAELLSRLSTFSRRASGPANDLTCG